MLTGGTAISGGPKRSEGKSLSFEFKMKLNLWCKNRCNCHKATMKAIFDAEYIGSLNLSSSSMIFS